MDWAARNQDCPGYITINRPPNFGGAVNYGSAVPAGSLPRHAHHDKGYLPNLQASSDKRLQRRQLDYIQSLNKQFAGAAGAPDDWMNHPVV